MSRERMVGTLRIVCESAQGLPRGSDGFMQIVLGTEKRRTRASGANPRWNETIELKGRLHDFLKPLSVSVLDDKQRQRGQPVVLGELSPVDLRQVLTQTDSRSFELDTANGIILCFSVEWAPLGGHGNSPPGRYGSPPGSGSRSP